MKKNWFDTMSRKSKNVLSEEIDGLVDKFKQRNYRLKYFIILFIIIINSFVFYGVYWKYILRQQEFVEVESNAYLELDGVTINITQEVLLYNNEILVPRASADVEEIYSHECDNMQQFFTEEGSFSASPQTYIESTKSIKTSLSDSSTNNIGGFTILNSGLDPIIDSDESVDISFYILVEGETVEYLNVFVVLGDELNDVMYVMGFQLSGNHNECPECTSSLKNNLDCTDYTTSFCGIYQDGLNDTTHDVWRNVLIEDVYDKMELNDSIGALKFKGIVFDYGTEETEDIDSTLYIDDLHVYTRPRYTQDFSGWYDEEGNRVDSYRFNVSYTIIILRNLFNISDSNEIFSEIELYVYDYTNITKLSANPLESTEYDVVTDLLSYSCIVDISEEENLHITNVTYEGVDAIMVNGTKLSNPIPFPYSLNLGRRLQYKTYCDYTALAEHDEDTWERATLDGYKYFDDFIISSKKGIIIF